MKNTPKTLGLDLGTTSIGWSIVDSENETIQCGVRIFNAGLDRFNSPQEASLNQERREKRSARRIHKRKAKRKAYLKECLKKLGWMPEDSDEIDAWNNLEAYALRSRAIREKISLKELGRTLLHLNQRRGFLSLRKTEESKDKESKGMLGEISALQKAIEDSGKETLGNYLFHLYQEEKENVRIRKRHIRREMLYHEFELIWEEQARHYPKILTDQLRWGTTEKRDKPFKVIKPIPREAGKTLLEQFGLENLIFFQRTVYWNTASIGHCELEPNEQRTPRADRRFQEFRMLQEVNNLRIFDASLEPKPDYRELSEAERSAILNYTYSQDKPKFYALKKKVAKIENSPEASQIVFNLESGGRKYISGMASDKALRSKKGYGPKWNTLPDADKDKIVSILTDPEATDDDMYDALITDCGLDALTAERLPSIKLEDGYGHLSKKALEKLLPFMRDGWDYMGKDFEDSAIHAAGYQRRDEEINKVFDTLPLIDSKELSHLPKINNPVVLRTLNELRKVVNAIIRKYGKPEAIHLELARDLKMGPDKRKEYLKKNRKHEAERKEAASTLTEWGVRPNGAAILLYRLWKEQKETCIYSGKLISHSQLIGSEIDIDHIIPGRSLDNSYLNKVVCFRNENADKGDRTPFQWLAEKDPKKYEDILQRASKLPFPKRKRFSMESIPEDWIARDLIDTAWISKVARQYLSCLLKAPATILCMKGAHTSKLREQWQLHGLLRNDGIDLKNRDDHRHHALDAAVIACCNHASLQSLSAIHKYETHWSTDPDKKMHFHNRFIPGGLNAPWKTFREDLEAALNKIIVSHRPTRKVSGKLHKETNYGATLIEGEIVHRKPVAALTSSEIPMVRDAAIRKIIQNHLEQGGSLDDTITMPNGRPIKKVRLIVKAKDAIPRKAEFPHELVRPQNTHHVTVCISEKETKVFPVSVFETTKRKRLKQPLYQDPLNDPKFRIMYLCKNDTIMITENGKSSFFVYKTMATTTLQMQFARINDATKKNQDPQSGKSLTKSCKPNTFNSNFPNARKVDILPTGEIRYA